MGYYAVRRFVDTHAETALIVSGVRKVGKTVILKQVLEYYGECGWYQDLKLFDFGQMDVYDEVRDQLVSGKKLILLDECTIMENVEYTIRELYELCQEYGAKLILSGSSIAHLDEIAYNWLGARCLKITIPIITFTEYLHIVGKLPTYLEDVNGLTDRGFKELKAYTQNISEQEFLDYLSLKGYSSVISSSAYLRSIVEETSKSNAKFKFMTVPVDFISLQAVVYSLVYKFFRGVLYRTFLEGHDYTRETYNAMSHEQIKSLGISRRDLNRLVSESSASNKLMMYDIKNVLKSYPTADLFSALEFLVNYGIAYVDFDSTLSVQDFKRAMAELKQEYQTKGSVQAQSMQKLFETYSISITSPILYYPIVREFIKYINTSLETQIERDELFKGQLLGELVENYIKGNAAVHSGYTPYTVQTIAQYLDQNSIEETSSEIDLFVMDLGLVCEITHKNKAMKDTNFSKLDRIDEKYKDTRYDICTRVLTTNSVFDVYEGVYRVPYYKLGIMLESLNFSKMMDLVEG